MQQGLTEGEYALIHALQLRPRATWSELSGVLGVAPGTLSRHWTAMVEAGKAWVTAYPRHQPTAPAALALLQVSCPAHQAAEIRTRLAADSRISTIEHVANGDLQLTVTGESLGNVSALVVDDISALPGVTAVRTHVVAEVHVEAASWRLDSLSRAQVTRLRSTPQAEGSGADFRSIVNMPDHYRDLVATLARDGRASAVDLAHQTGRPPSTVRRQLTNLMKARALSFRCEVAQSFTRWPLSVMWWLHVPESSRTAMLDAVRAHPMVRMCMSTAGAANMALQLWLQSPREVMRVEAWLARVAPDVRVLDADAVLRITKRMGWILDADGRATGEVVPIWPPRFALREPGGVTRVGS